MKSLSFVFLLSLCFTSTAWASDQTFEQALAQAYQNNPTLQAERAKLRSIDEKVSEAQSGWRPSAEASAEIGKSKQTLGSGGNFSGSDELTPRDAGITVTQPLFRGFRTTGNIKSAKAEVLAQRARLLAAEQQLLYAAAKAYLDVVQAQNVVKLTRNNEEVLKKQLDSTNIRLKNGEVTKTDVSQAEARLSVALALRIQADGDLSNTQATYNRIIGHLPGTLEYPQLTLETPTSLNEAVEITGRANPEIIAALYGQDAAKANVDVAKGNLLPEINLVANASRGWDQSLVIPNRQDSSTIMARVTIPLYRSGVDYAKTRAAQETVTQRRFELEDARTRARESTITAWQSLTTTRASIMAHKAAVAATELALNGVRVESQVGTRTTLDVLNAEQELLSAKVNLVKSMHDEALAILQVKATTGSLTAKLLNLPVALYDATEHYQETDGKWLGLGSTD
ncbi:MAG: TolC family outer membrane protein [Alphaproteobacteria bacterium]|nr:TolC family outer membrane protein [Alphaproteobacteria bacterium]